MRNITSERQSSVASSALRAYRSTGISKHIGDFNNRGGRGAGCIRMCVVDVLF